MAHNNLISIQQFCSHYNIPAHFISALHEYELIEITTHKGVNYIKITQINKVEKMLRLHYDLDINLEGLDAIYNLLKQVDALKQEITALHNRIRLYEDF